MNGKIDITGADLVQVAKIAYDLSKPQGLGFMHFQPGPLDNETARECVDHCARIPHIALDMDYVNGRACKLSVFRDGDKLWIDDRWYDHTPEQHAELVRRIRETIPGGAA